MKLKNKIISISFALLIIIFMLLASRFIIKEKNHDCSGTGCEICYEIKLCKDLITNARVSLSINIIFLLFLCIFLNIHNLLKFYSKIDTLVELKEKLSY